MAISSVLSIAGSDSSGGAGIQADIKAIAAHGLFAQTAITALTAQNTTGVFGIMEVPPSFVSDQIKAVFSDIVPDAVKIGMVASPEIVTAIARSLSEVSAKNVVLDPVMVATSGSALSSASIEHALINELFPLAKVVTPNIPEAQVLSGLNIEFEQDMERAAEVIFSMMPKDSFVLIKGGHLESSANDLLFGCDGPFWLYQERFATENSHGTGCTLSSAIACGLAVGKGVRESVASAKEYLNGALQHDPMMGKGNGPLDHMWAYRQSLQLDD